MIILGIGSRSGPRNKRKLFRRGRAICEMYPILSLPDGSKEFVVYCDASNQGLGCVLMQRDKVENATAEMLHGLDQLMERKEGGDMYLLWVPLIGDVKILMDGRGEKDIATYASNCLTGLNVNAETSKTFGFIVTARDTRVESIEWTKDAITVNAARHNLLLLLKVNAARHKLTTAVEIKPAESEGFEQIVDFLNAHTIKYALTVNPTIYTSCIEQFWATVKVKTVNGEQQLQALVDGKKIVVTEASVRRDLQLDDEEGTDCLPNATIFEELTRMGSARIVSSDEASLGDHTDASKQGRKFFDIDADEDITPENVHDAEMFDVNDLHGDEVSFEKEVPVKEVSVVGKVNTASIATTVSAATITKDEITLAQAWQS
ncbi:putative ribonuclease H-like domain-containing protein [Tanacetum coccineum]